RPVGSSLPPESVRLPPRLRVLQVRYMPDIAVLAALAALPYFTRLDCTAVRHPRGEICLDLGSIGLPGPPDLSAAAAATAAGSPTTTAITATPGNVRNGRGPLTSSVAAGPASTSASAAAAALSS
ncbi:hypothetical protein Agub_g10862, partial [Astrephomene gubernaculifera]